MAQATDRIERELLAEPHVAGRRIPVFQLHDLVEGRGLAPTAVADRFDLEPADVYRAMAYYHEHPDEMEQVREQRREAFADFRERVDRPSDVTPDG